MALRKFVKMYSVNPDRIDENGNLDPDAGLYPGYASQYGYAEKNEKDLPEHFGQPIEYDNKSNVHPNREVTLYNADGDPMHTHKVGPSVNRGFSVNAYRGKNKRPVGMDKTDTFDMWMSNASDELFWDDTPKPNRDRAYSTAVDPAKRVSDILPYKIDGVWHNTVKDKGAYENLLNYRSATGKSLNDPNKDSGLLMEDGGMLEPDDSYTDMASVDSFNEKMQDVFGRKVAGSSYNFNTGKYGDSRLITIPVIVEADDEDVININDVLNNNYDPTRDYQEEVQLKCIRGRRLPKGLFKKQSLYDECIKTVTSYYETFLELRANLSEGVSDENDVLSMLGYAWRDLDRKFSSLTAQQPIPGLSGCINELGSLMSKLDAECADDNVPKFSFVTATCDEAANVFGHILDILKAGGVSGSGGGRVIYSPGIINNIDEWFSYDDPGTYSDERMKDIYDCLSDDGCTDINLSDNHIKQITDDFRKFMRGKDDNSAILSGLRELGQ